METICPFCHQKHAISQADVGKQMRCPGCHHTFTANPLTGLGIKTRPPSVAPPVGTRNPPAMSPVMPTLPNAGPPTQASADRLASLSEAGTEQPADLLAGYRGVRGRSASPFTRIVEAIKKAIKVAQLRRQVTGLQQALDAAWEKLGMLAIGHRPFHPHLRAELPELSALQRQVSEKQSMADSLRQVKGSRPALKEVEAELAELRDRQRRLLIAIGQKAEASAPDIPDGPAHYAAVKRLRSSLEAAERELLGIEGASRMPAGRLGTRGSDFLSRAKMPLIAAGAVLAIALVLCAGWWLLTPSVPRHIKKAIFDESEFSEPLTLELPGDDREEIARRKAGQGVLWWLPAVNRFQYPAEQRDALLDLLIRNGFAQMEAGRPGDVPLLMYRDALKPYCVKKKTLSNAPWVPEWMKGSHEQDCEFTKPFHIGIANRQLKSIDSTKAYRGKNLFYIKADYYAVNFSYRLKGTFPGLPTCDTVFKGKATALYDPIAEEWEAFEVELGDEGGREYLKLLAERKKRGP